MSDFNDWNSKVIEEFRANDGNVEQFRGMQILLLHHTGAKSGKSYVNRMPTYRRMIGADRPHDCFQNRCELEQ